MDERLLQLSRVEHDFLDVTASPLYRSGTSGNRGDAGKQTQCRAGYRGKGTSFAFVLLR